MDRFNTIIEDIKDNKPLNALKELKKLETSYVSSTLNLFKPYDKNIPLNRFKDAVKTIIANNKEAKIQKKYEQLKKEDDIDAIYKQYFPNDTIYRTSEDKKRIIERTIAFNIQKNNLITEIQQSLNTQTNDILISNNPQNIEEILFTNKDRNRFKLNEEKFKDNKEFKRFIKILKLLEELISRNTHLLRDMDYSSVTYESTFTKIKKCIAPKAYNKIFKNRPIKYIKNVLNSYDSDVKKISNNIITLEQLIHFLYILNNYTDTTSAIFAEKCNISIVKYNKINGIDFNKGNIDYNNLVKYYSILAGIKLNIINFITKSIIIDNYVYNNNSYRHNYNYSKKIANSKSSISAKSSNKTSLDIHPYYYDRINIFNIYNTLNTNKTYKRKTVKLNHLLYLFNKDQTALNRIERTLTLLKDLYYRNIINDDTLFHYIEYGQNINDIINHDNLTFEIVDKVFKNSLEYINEIKNKEITIDMLKKLSDKLSVLYYSINNDIVNLIGKDFVKFKIYIYTDDVYDYKIGNFAKGYKDYKNNLRYISNIKDISFVLKDVLYSHMNLYRLKNNDIPTPKSSNKSYKTIFRKNVKITSTNYNPNVFNKLKPEPKSAFKSSPVDVTDIDFLKK